jgi:enterochelin esterase-like enzyme
MQRHRESAATAAALESAIAEIEAGRKTTPLIGEPAAGGDAPVTFLAERAGNPVPRIVSDVTGWGEHLDGTFDVTIGTMTRVGRSDWYSLQVNVAPRARVEYLVAYGQTDYRLDPHNPRHVEAPPASEFVMPGYLPPPELADPTTPPAGLMTEATIQSPSLGGSCHLVVYTPSGYRDDGDYAVAVFCDRLPGQVPRVLDWLIARQAIEPIVAVFVESTPPDDGARTGAPLRTFLTGELLTWLSSHYAVGRNAGKRAIIGISYSAKDALDAALTSADGFARLGLSIPGRRIVPSDVDAIARRRNHRVRVAILAGRYDQANVATARAVQQALANAGHNVDYTEVPEGHSPRTWLNNLRVVLVSLFGPSSGRAAEVNGTR